MIVGRVSVCVCVVGGAVVGGVFSFRLSPSSDTCSTVFNTGLAGLGLLLFGPGLAGISRF